MTETESENVRVRGYATKEAGAIDQAGAVRPKYPTMGSRRAVDRELRFLRFIAKPFVTVS